MKRLWRNVRHAVEALFEKIWTSLVEENDYPPPETGDAGSCDAPDGQSAEVSAPPAEGTAVTSPAAPALDWRYGGFNGAGAVEDPETQIRNLRMDGDGLRYDWETGGCENFGASSRTDYGSTLACAFFWDGARWVGGKFDWISTSRTSRSFENIRSGYGGWNAEAFFSAPRRAFCVASANGRRRTNLIEC